MNIILKKISTTVFYPKLLQDFLTISVQKYGEKTALISGGKKVTYNELNDYSSRFANFLANKNIRRGERVIILLDNSIEVIVSLFGTLKNNSVFVILSSSTKSRNLGYIIKDSGASLVVTDVKREKIIEEVRNEDDLNCKILWIGDKREIKNSAEDRDFFWDDLSGFNSELSVGERNIDIDLAALIYTSGTTGRSKGIMCSHRSMISAAQSIIQYIGNSPDDIILSVLPLSFDYGLYQVLMSVIFGGTVIIEKGFLFINELLKIIEKQRVTGFPIVPTILAMILNLKKLSSYDLSSLRYMTNTGAAIPIDHIKRIRSIFPDVKFFSMYGLSECKRVAYLSPDEIDRRPGSVGKAIPNCEVFIVDEKGQKVSPGEVGELVVRGSNLMSGYWNSPDLTEEKFKVSGKNSERLLYTGDYFKQDSEGYLYFVSRKDEMIKCKGERVSPKEIEETISELKSVSEVAVIGIEDLVLGQAIKAFVVPVDSKNISPDEISKHCTASLEDFKIPKYIEIVDGLPRNSNGKVDKKSLKAQENAKV